MTPIPPTSETPGLRDFIENGCDARPEDKHHAIQELDALECRMRDALADAETKRQAFWEAVEEVKQLKKAAERLLSSRP